VGVHKIGEGQGVHKRGGKGDAQGGRKGVHRGGGGQEQRVYRGGVWRDGGIGSLTGLDLSVRLPRPHHTTLQD
jgi:hypothetical protein